MSRTVRTVRTHRKRFSWAAILAATLVGVVFAVAGGAFADDISNNLDTSVDAVAETMPLTAGGSAGTTRLYIIPKNDDGKSGCNLTGSTTATISLSSSDTSVASVSPSSVTFTNCATSTTGPVVTITPLSAGSADITATLIGNTTDGTFNVSPVKFTVNVSAPTPTNTPPHIGVSGVTGGANYDKGSVPAATCNVTDAEDGNSSFDAKLGAITGSDAEDGIGSQTASCSYTDSGGLTATDSVTYNIVDPSAPTIGYTLTPTSPDGLNGWYTSNVTLTWNVTENESPSSLEKTGCVDQHITADQAETTYSCSATSAGGSASQVDVKIKRDATAPSVTGVSVTSNGSAYTPGSWATHSVTVSWNCSDNGSGATKSSDMTVLSDDTSNGSVTPSCTDNAGNIGTATAVSPIMIDTIAPAINDEGPTSAPDGSNGWYTDDVVNEFSASDEGSGLASSCSSEWTKTTTGEGNAVSVASGACADVAGNSNPGISSASFKIDKTAPTISHTVTPASPDGTGGWYKTAPTVQFTCGDATSGVATCVADDASPASDSITLGESASAQTVGGTATDNAGLTSTDSVTGLKVDLSDPSVDSWSGGPADGGAYYFGFVPSAPTCTGSDAISGLAGCVVSGYSTALGSHTLTATATDNAGRTKTATRSYTVLSWTLNGFYQPTDMSGVWNTVKNGSTVPLKFEIFAGSTELTTTSSVSGLAATPVACPTTGYLADPIEVTATGGTALRYDTTAGQFVYNWQTPKKAGACYTVTMTAQDGSSLKANFMLK